MVEYGSGYKKLTLLPRLAILLVLIAGVFVAAYYTGMTREYCGTDTNCFLEKAQACKPAEVFQSQNNNIYYYKVYPRPTNTCMLFITLKTVQEGSLPEHKELLEGKTMTCTVPKENMKSLDVNDVNNILEFCSGPLKEAIYELIIKRMYELVITNLGEIAEQVMKI